jgi:hypothetical protein
MQSPVDRIEQLDAMRMGVDYRLPIRIRTFSLHVRPLTIAETVEIAGEVTDELERLGKAATRVIEHVLLAKRTLIKASTSEPGANDQQLSDPILDRMTPDELDLLFKQYVAACDKVNPSLESLPAEEVRAMAERLKKSPSEAIELSFLQLVNIVQFLLTPDA